MTYQLHQGDCLAVLPTLAENSIAAIVTDPPYGLEFMGKEWDRFTGYFSASDGGRGADGMSLPRQRTRNIKCDECGKWVYDHAARACTCGGVRRTQMRNFEEWAYRWAVAALRVAKPGAHLLAFGGTRTFHRLTCAIEDAGWEIRDTLMWVYGSGFPKSADVSKHIDKQAGAEREIVGRKTGRAATPVQDIRGGAYAGGNGKNGSADCSAITAPATPEAAQWAGWGTALKPAWEPIIMARKPLQGTVAQNVLTWGTGGINVDGCRVGTEEAWVMGPRQFAGKRGGIMGETVPRLPSESNPAGRWPANLVHDGSDEVLAGFPVTTSGGAIRRSNGGDNRAMSGKNYPRDPVESWSDTGSAARFFYCAKASKADRDEGLEGWAERRAGAMDGNHGRSGPRVAGDGITPVKPVVARNHHPTVKPIALMQWLVTLVTPPGGTVLDPFAGSGSTGKAAVLCGFHFVGIDLDAEYLAIAQARIEHAAAQPPLLPADLLTGPSLHQPELC